MKKKNIGNKFLRVDMSRNRAPSIESVILRDYLPRNLSSISQSDLLDLKKRLEFSSSLDRGDGLYTNVNESKSKSDSRYHSSLKSTIDFITKAAGNHTKNQFIYPHYRIVSYEDVIALCFYFSTLSKEELEKCMLYAGVSPPSTNRVMEVSPSSTSKITLCCNEISRSVSSSYKNDFVSNFSSLASSISSSQCSSATSSCQNKQYSGDFIGNSTENLFTLNNVSMFGLSEFNSSKVLDTNDQNLLKHGERDHKLGEKFETQENNLFDNYFHSYRISGSIKTAPAFKRQSKSYPADVDLDSHITNSSTSVSVKKNENDSSFIDIYSKQDSKDTDFRKTMFEDSLNSHKDSQDHVEAASNFMQIKEKIEKDDLKNSGTQTIFDSVSARYRYSFNEVQKGAFSKTRSSPTFHTRKHFHDTKHFDNTMFNPVFGSNQKNSVYNINQDVKIGFKQGGKKIVGRSSKIMEAEVKANFNCSSFADDKDDVCINDYENACSYTRHFRFASGRYRSILSDSIDRNESYNAGVILREFKKQEYNNNSAHGTRDMFSLNSNFDASECPHIPELNPQGKDCEHIEQVNKNVNYDLAADYNQSRISRFEKPGSIMSQDEDSIDKTGDIPDVPFIVYLFLISINMVFGMYLFKDLSPGSKLADGLYFTVVLLTTIGFGDILPDPTHYLTLALYVFFGLALANFVTNKVIGSILDAIESINSLGIDEEEEDEDQ